MKILNLVEPKVTLIHQSKLEELPDRFSGQWIINNQEFELTDLELIPEFAGRLCYMSFDKPRPGGNPVYLDHILDSKHTSVLEHSCIGILFEGVSRSFTHELVRHRVGMSYSQLSQRYVDDVSFVIPPEINNGPNEDKLLWEEICILSLINYQKLLQSLDKRLPKKQARETARSVLPNCVETKILVTGNITSWRHFLWRRGNVHADLEMRLRTVDVYRILNEIIAYCLQDTYLDKCEKGYPMVVFQ